MTANGASGNGGFDNNRDPNEHPSRRLSHTGTSLYAILELEKGATAEEVKKRYRRLALKYHPDKNPNDKTAEAKFKEINHAHSVLSDDSKRDIYNKYGSLGLYIAEQVGEDNVHSYFLLSHPCCKIAMLLICLLTGCCCCCCYCCYCNFCCGKCAPEQYEEGADDDDDSVNDDHGEKYSNMQESDSASAGGNSPIVMEPGRTESSKLMDGGSPSKYSDGSAS